MGRTILIVTAAIQAIVGIFQVFASSLLFDSTDDISVAIAQLYGVSVLIIAVVSVSMLLAYKTREHLLASFITLFIFHLGLGSSQAFALTKNYGHFSYPLINLTFAALFTFLIIKEVKTY